MNLFKYNKNGKLYTLSVIRFGLGTIRCATPYNHNNRIGLHGTDKFKASMKFSDFSKIAELMHVPADTVKF